MTERAMKKNNEIIDRMSFLMLSRQWDLDALSYRSGIPKRTLQNYVYGSSTITLASVYKLEAAFGQPIVTVTG